MSAISHSRRRWARAAGLATVALAGAAAVWIAAAPSRQAATPLNSPDLPNAFRVDANLYRGAQPTPAGLADLRARGVRTVIDLAGFPGEREQAKSAGLEHVSLPGASRRLDADRLVGFLRVAGDAARGPVFVHCAEGRHRTGTAVAVYRIVVNGWSRREALDEMIDGPFGSTADRATMADYLDRQDIEALKRRAGLH